ncbi:Nudix hydrolase YfcD [Bacillus sp. JCM 19047]|uniref:NUDIX hydrolase n=1 Tax=Shouchella miscanthi TaxID=2598861 RepID=UPI0003EFFA1F|nr:NUDIX domain-containing protein [Shouchella miscanthi]GAF20920.1 Nudix hydrolase YfcD [Bacillus sp. JCM 19047]
MNNEMISYFTHAKKPLGSTSREQIHQNGLWHETFHLWMINNNNREPQIYLQLRSQTKKDFPNLFDITAAGHLHSKETTLDGLREVEEELGIALSSDDIYFIGQFLDRIHTKPFLDNEIASSYVHFTSQLIESFSLQKEEVAGMVAIPFHQFKEVCFGLSNSMVASGYKEEGNQRIALEYEITLDDLVPHSLSYLKQTVIALEDALQRQV